MPSKRTKRPPAQAEQRWQWRDWRTEGTFAVAVLALCATWLLGLTLRARLWTVDIDIVRRSGIFRVVGSDVSDMMGVAFVIGLATLLYLLCLRALRTGFRHSYAAAIVATVLGCLVFLPSVELTSPDAVHLAADVRTFWLHGKLPVTRDAAPSRIDDPVAREVRAFSDSPSGYGPVAYAIGGAPIPFVGDGLRANLFGQKVVAAIFLVVTAVLGGLVAKQIGGNPGLVTGLIGLNPLMLWQFPGDGHDDSLMAALGVGALLLVTRAGWGSRAGGLGLAVASVLAKFGLLLASPILGAYWFPRWRLLLAGAIALCAVGAFVLFAFRLGPGIGTIGPASAIAPTTPWGVLADWADAQSDGKAALVGVSYALFFVLLAYIVAYHRLVDPQDLITAFATATFLFLFVCSPGYLPWYQVWYLPFAMISGRRWLVVTSIVFSVGAFLPILAINWAGPIQTQMHISNPLNKAVIVLYLAVAVVAIVLQRSDRSRERVAAAKAGRPAPVPRRQRIRGRT
ncbi:MAG: hypothetical protein ABIP13_06955 [Tepidiformaceae bacterium]